MGLRTPLKTQKTKNSKPPAVHIQGYSGLHSLKIVSQPSAPHSASKPHLVSFGIDSFHDALQLVQRSALVELTAAILKKASPVTQCPHLPTTAIGHVCW